MMVDIGVRCHVCGRVHVLSRDEGYEPRGWRVRYTYRCPVAKRTYKVYAQGELVVLESETVSMEGPLKR